MEAAGAKRKRALESWSVDEVVAWLRGCDVVAGDALDVLVAKVTEGEIDGEVLSTVTEADLGARHAPAQRCAGAAVAPGAALARARALRQPPLVSCSPPLRC